jgi:PAS domain S-box-containing protein
VRGSIQGIVQPDGGVRWYSVSASAVDHDEDGIPDAVVVSFADITALRNARERLAASETELQEAQQIAKVGSWTYDVEADRIEWSDQLYRIFGHTPDSFAPSFEGYTRTLHPADRDRVVGIIQRAMQTGGRYEVEHRIIRPDGTERAVESYGEVLVDDEGRPLYLKGTAQDVTERTAARRALRRYADELEERNTELQQFAYVASHDLQEPLRMVSSFLQLLQRRYEGQLDDKADTYIEYAVDGARRMQALIQDLLAYSRVGTRGQPFEPVDLGALAATVRHDLGQALADRDAEVEIADLPTVPGDPSQLRQVVQNLIANAIKFTPPERTPRVHVGAHEQDEVWQIDVTDNGIGIDAEYAERVFQIFQRLHTRDEYEGTGIGLAICKKIVERHGGTIWYESRRGEGTRFSFTLAKVHDEDPVQGGLGAEVPPQPVVSGTEMG